MNCGLKSVALLIAGMACAAGQTLSNATLNGKYFARHVQFTTDTSNNVTDARSITGTATFNGSGGYSFTGQQVVGTGSAAAYTSSGTYALTAAGVVTLTNPQRASLTVNARYAAEAVAGSSTEANGGTVDLFIAIPAPASSTKIANSSLSGTYYAADFELPAASMAQVRNAWVSWTADGAGNLGAVSVAGHAANVEAGQRLSQSVAGASYVLNSDGTGTATFPFVSGGNLGNTLLNGAVRVLQVSASGNVVLGATAGAHDVLIAVKGFSGTATNSSAGSSMWFAGLRADPQGGALSFVGTQRAGSMMVYSRRLNLASYPTAVYETSAVPFTVAADGTGSMSSSKLGLGVGGGLMARASVDLSLDPTGYEIALAVGTPQFSGSGVFINPLGIVNTASFAPAVDAISPGEFLAIYGSGLAAAPASALPPFPTSGVGGVTVSIGGHAAAVNFVSPGQVDCIVPYGVTGATADIVVTNNGVKSNTVTLPLAATSPAVFTQDSSGLNDGAILHVDNSLVTGSSPATKGETVQMFVSGLGAVTSAIADGAGASGANPAKTTLQVLVDGVQATVQYAGMTTLPGLYQINVRIPTSLKFSGELPVAIVTPDALYDMASIAVQ